ncbi:unnamed protein product [Lathyrus oleraceus]|uniref:zinc finger protein ZAT11 n=1 Tax=Pisum sativum TaxID=3888 RepID=UPI0021CFB732|nr:zinc finger protein ZAT11-like [Pisum sativum]
MKRQRDVEGLENINLSNCLMMLSYPQHQQQQRNKPHQKSYGPVEYECKTCNKKFSSFQALGGHSASHKRSKLEGGEFMKTIALSLSLGNKPKVHECSICGQEFSLGQALGGHMRRHKALSNQEFSSIEKVVKLPVLQRLSSARALCLDLNLTPLENDLKLLFGKMAPNLDVLV